MNNPRNIINQILNKNNLMEVNNFLNLTIIKTLFNYKLKPNSNINKDINLIQINEEEKEICNIINRIKNELDDDYEIVIFYEIENENEIVFNKNIINKEENTEIKKVNNSNSNEFYSKNTILSQTNASSKNFSKKKIFVYSEENEKSFTSESKITNNELITMNNNSLFDLLNSIIFQEKIHFLKI